MACLRSGDLQIDDFLKLIETMELRNNSLLLAFTNLEARFAQFEFDAAFLSRTEHGRIFSVSGELKWRRLQETTRVVYLGEGPGPSTLGDWSHELSDLSPQTRDFLLWGERTDTKNEWLEQQVPHRFSYPIDTDRFPRGRVALVVEDWADSYGIPHFSRYHSIKEVHGGK